MDTTTIRVTCRCGTTCEISAVAIVNANRYMQEFLEAHDDCEPKPPRIEQHTHITEEKVVWQEYAVGDKITFRFPNMESVEYIVESATPVGVLFIDNGYTAPTPILTLRRLDAN